MKELIDKAAVVAEIERLREEEYPCDTFEESTGYYNALDEIATFLDTLEVKDVDLKRAIDKWIDDTAITHEDCSVADVISTAKYFFKLGIKTKEGE